MGLIQPSLRDWLPLAFNPALKRRAIIAGPFGTMAFGTPLLAHSLSRTLMNPLSAYILKAILRDDNVLLSYQAH